jgi:hypothetical protein
VIIEIPEGKLDQIIHTLDHAKSMAESMKKRGVDDEMLKRTRHLAECVIYEITVNCLLETWPLPKKGARTDES